MDAVSAFEASIMLGVPEYLVRDFSEFGYNGRRLPSLPVPSSTDFLVSEVLDFIRHLNAPLSSPRRQKPPKHVMKHLVIEAQGLCALCRTAKPNYEFAHIEPWSKSQCNSPHNLLHLCLDCHRTRGTDVKLLRSLKEELLRRSSPLGDGIVYSCSEILSPGDLVYVLNGIARASDASDANTLAAGLVRTKIGRDRCIVQRAGVATGLMGLIPGEYYFLSPTSQGRVVQYSAFEQLRDKSKHTWLQGVGRAESSTHLAIQMGTPIQLPPEQGSV